MKKTTAGVKRVRHAKTAKPLYKTHANFDLSEDSEDEEKKVALANPEGFAKFEAMKRGTQTAPTAPTAPTAAGGGGGESQSLSVPPANPPAAAGGFADLLKKYKKPEEPISKYLLDFCKYKLYLAYFAQDNTREPPSIAAGDAAPLINDKQSIAQAYAGYNEFKRRLPKFKEDTLAAIGTCDFLTEIKQCKELHVVLRKRQLVLGNGKHMTCFNDQILHLFLAVHMTVHFESYLAHMLEDLWTTLEREIQGMTFCFIFEMFLPHFQPFRLIFQRSSWAWHARNQ